ncbi:ATP-binding protein [Novosphingobium sp. KACC 22771]|uniref:ATP-binding protein n=1 Tax=Novosphingobium sp. KACC 22771 TaxID=3025670 RepID=UPI0023673B37|nr:ATP-binding protein [Novosphingobium sp. KACC 22771]WDF70998.1 ATP-binding protein [Novosphingobium sp. KACC 22771]
MTASIIIGEESNGKAVPIDIEELLATRLLVQGNSGSGKSHLLRRLLEESAPLVQQVVVDPEGDFVTLAEPFGHIVVDGAAYNTNDLVRLANRVRQHRASVVLALDGLEIEAQMRCAATFLNALFDAPREIWYPALVVVDEAQMFAPAAAGDVTDEVRRLSLSAMTNLMCRGRKRGLAGIIATQRLAKLAKNVAAEASNFLMGRTFLDIDMQRAADLLGMDRRQAETIRDLQRGQFLALGPAITRRPLSVRIGGVKTRSQAVSTGLLPPPSVTGDDLHALLHAAPTAEELAAEETPLLAGLPRPDAGELMEQIGAYVMAPAPGEEPLVDDSGPNLFSAASVPAPPSLPPDEVQAIMAAIMEDITAERDCTYQPISSLFQDFTTRCRMKKIGQHIGDATQFRRRFALAVAGIYRPADEEWAPLLQLSRTVPDDLLTPFLVIARAAMDEAPCPDDEALARAYGTSSPGRIRRLLEHLEKSGLIVVKTDYSGRRSIGIPDLGVSTAAV